MRILFVNDYGTLTGGAEILLHALREEFRRRGHDARLFASRARPLGAASFADFDGPGTLTRFRTLLQTANPGARKALAATLKRFRPDVVHVKLFLTQLSPLILPLLRDLPCLLHVAWYRPICPTGTKRLPRGVPCRVRAGWPCYTNRCLPLHDWIPLMIQGRLLRRYQRVFDLVVANSCATRSRLLADGFPCHAVIPNGVMERPPRPPLAEPPTAAYSGRLVPEKGVDVLLRAFARVVAKHPTAKLLVAGAGPEEGRLKRLVATLGLIEHVVWLGHLSSADQDAALAGAWVQVVPSLWEEPFGLVAAEAMMRGAAVIASDTGGLAEIVREDRTGWRVPPGDAGALEGRLNDAFGNREMTERFGEAGRAVARVEYAIGKHADRFMVLYERLLHDG